MPKLYQILTKSQRLPVIVLALLSFMLLLMVDAQYFFVAPTPVGSEAVILWISFGFSFATSLTFLAVGVLVWLYARNRSVAFRLLGFCLAMMVVFTLEISSSNNLFFEFLSGMSSVLAVILLSTFLVIFPRSLLVRPVSQTPETGGAVSFVPTRIALFLRVYLWLLGLGGCGLVGLYVYIFIGHFERFPWMSTSRSLYFCVALTGIICLISWSYCQSPLARERQQLALFVSGVVITTAPLLLFVVVPQVFNSHSVNSRMIAATMCFFPLTLGYSILRYQILIFDSYVRRAVSAIFGLIFLATLMYVMVAVSNLLAVAYTVQHKNIYLLFIVCSTAFLAPLVWWLAQRFTEQLFFREVLHYRRLLDEPTVISDETLSVSDAASLIMSAAIHTFDTQQVCVFVFDESSGLYRLYPLLMDEGGDAGDSARSTLLMDFLKVLQVEDCAQDTEGFFLPTHLLAIQHLEVARRPLLLSEAIRPVENIPTLLERFMAASSPLGNKDWLLAPLRAQGKMIGFVVLGERGDHLPYAGPDLEIAHLLAARFAMVLETSRLYVRATQHTALLNSLYSVSTRPHFAFETVLDAAYTYALVAADATASAAEVWLYESSQDALQLVIATDRGPRLQSQTRLLGTQKSDWSSHFFEGGNEQQVQYAVGSTPVPACLTEMPTCPFAWLPLVHNQQWAGVLVITYQRSHFFSRAEMRVLELFASQCVATLVNVQMTMELRAAYERQKELDLLKDQFIMTASHELRTPLTTVLGYIELLDQYHERLEVESRAEFIEKARRGCDELTLLVSNIMDASRITMDGESVRLRSIPLQATVTSVLELLEATITSEQRYVTVDIPADLSVRVDDVRLRQVLLNLMSNALKYSIEGSPVQIVAHYQPGQAVVVQVRDEGLGVPLAAQQRLFERFVRLERDINSPVRGAGLGLFICRRLLETMGGAIWVESSGQPGEGSVFSFSLQPVFEKSAAEVAVAQHRS